MLRKDNAQINIRILIYINKANRVYIKKSYSTPQHHQTGNKPKVKKQTKKKKKIVMVYFSLRCWNDACAAKDLSAFAAITSTTDADDKVYGITNSPAAN
jgi:hypothetical protein